MADFVKEKLWERIVENTSDTEAAWLKQKGAADSLELMTAFVAAPRFLSKKIVKTSASEQAEPINIEGWSLVRLCRVWLLTQLDAADKQEYIHNIETLFDTAELNELVALYSALPLFAYPEQWLLRATDAVRSNMGFVFDAIAFHNAYPDRYFSEAAWNQLVLKTIFNDKPIHLIDGLSNRANATLASILSDFAHERWAAGRSVPPQVWRLISPFVDDNFLKDLEYLFQTDVPANQYAAAIVCKESGYAPALQLLSQYPALERMANQGEITWANLE
jgi:hypothetical protein